MNILFNSLKPYFNRYKWYWIGGFIFILFSNAFSIYPAQVVRYAFDLVGELIEVNSLLSGFDAQAYLIQSLTHTLAMYALVVIVMALIRGVFLFLVRQTLIVVSRKIEFEQKADLYDKYQRYSLSIMRRNQTGDLMSRISEDVGNVRMFTGPGIMYTLNTGLMFFLILFIMFFVNVELTLYVMLPLPLMAIAIYYVHSIIIKRSEESQAQLSKITSFVQETFSGIRLLKAYGREKIFNTKYVTESNTYRMKAMRLVQIDALFFPLISLLVGMSNICIVWIGGEKVISGTLTLGNIAEFIIYVNLLVWPIAALGWVTSLFQKAVASQKRLNEMLALESEIIYPQSSEPISKYSIKFENVNFTYSDTGITGLKNFSVDIPEGTVLGVIGVTGSGKTTFANLLCRLFDVDSGNIYIGNSSLSSYSREAIRSSIAYVPQDVFLFSDSLSANISFGKDHATEDEIIEAAKFAGVYNDIMDFPDKFNTIIGERGVTLSGGQKQRVSIARAYLLRSKIIILDDSLSAIDAKTEEFILQNIRTQMSDGNYSPTLILISHRISSLQNADNIIVLDQGHLIESGSHNQLIEAKGTYFKLQQRQKLEAEIQAFI